MSNSKAQLSALTMREEKASKLASGKTTENSAHALYSLTEDVERLSKEKIELTASKERLTKRANEANRKSEIYEAGPLLPKELILSLAALFIVIVSITIAQYRFHQKEIAKNEHFHLGFLRIRIAAYNENTEGFDTEVRVALTQNSLNFSIDSLFDKGGKKVESPIPGHPTSDLATGMINKLLEQVEVGLKRK